MGENNIGRLGHGRTIWRCGMLLGGVMVKVHNLRLIGSVSVLFGYEVHYLEIGCTIWSFSMLLEVLGGVCFFGFLLKTI